MLRFNVVFKNLVLGFLCISLIGCAYGSGEDEKNREQQETRENLQALYTPYVGTFEGEIDARGLKVPVTIWSYIIERQRQGRNQNGEPLLPYPELTLRYRRGDVLEPDRLLTATLDKTTGDVLATSDSPSVLNLKFRLANNQLIGEVITAEGKLGNFQTQKTAGEGYAPQGGVDLDYRTRYYETHFPYFGIYKGIATPLVGAPYEVQFRFDYLLVQASGIAANQNDSSPIESKKPYLAGYFDYKQLGFFATKSSIEWNQTPARLTMVLIGNSNGGPGFSFSGTITENEIIGTAQFNTSQAQVRATKVVRAPRVQP